MLIPCPECECNISDKALTCPHCGCPLGNNAKPKTETKSTRKTETTSRTRKKKHMRLPNGFGQISEIKNRNLRKPFRAMVTVGKDANGRPICKTLKPEGYFKTYNEAYEALIEYNKNPYDLRTDSTFKDVYEAWYTNYSKTAAQNTLKHYTTAYKNCADLHSRLFVSIRTRDMRRIMNNPELSDSTIVYIRNMFSKLYAYAKKMELVNVNYAETLEAPKIKSNPEAHKVFTEDEMNILWANKDRFAIKVLLIDCYSGWRPSELLEMKLKDVDLKAMTFVGGMKTESSMNRVVPIHSKVQDLVTEFYNDSVNAKSEYLISLNGRPFSYRTFLTRLRTDCHDIDMLSSHKLHDCRVTFVTAAKNANMDEYALKRIVGHTISDITEKVYTKRSVDWLRSEIEKIK